MRQIDPDNPKDSRWAASMVALLRAAVKEQRKPPSGQWRSRGASALDPYRYELTDLRTNGASMREIQLWIAANAGLDVHRSTIWRRLQKWGIE